jgi:hypothetical protein
MKPVEKTTKRAEPVAMALRLYEKLLTTPGD